MCCFVNYSSFEIYSYYDDDDVVVVGGGGGVCVCVGQSKYMQSEA